MAGADAAALRARAAEAEIEAVGRRDHGLRRRERGVPGLPGRGAAAHWSFPDRSKATASDEEQLAVYRRVRDAIRARVEELVREEAG